MSGQRSNTLRQLLVVAVFAGLGGASLLYWGAPNGSRVQRAAEEKRSRDFETKISAEPDRLTGEALAYIEAVINCECEGILARTEWFQTRRERLAADGASHEDLDLDGAVYCEDYCDRAEDGYRIAPEGVDDPYLFFPGITYRYVGRDEGRKDLETTVATRAWIEIRFPSPAQCLRDTAGNTLSAITIGLNVSPEGRIVKAAVLGNAEIEWDTARYSW